MTDNKYWVFLENLRKSGETNMYGASPYLQMEFGMSEREAVKVLADWMRNYKRSDYK